MPGRHPTKAEKAAKARADKREKRRRELEAISTAPTSTAAEKLDAIGKLERMHEADLKREAQRARHKAPLQPPALTVEEQAAKDAELEAAATAWLTEYGAECRGWEAKLADHPTYPRCACGTPATVSTYEGKFCWDCYETYTDKEATNAKA